MTVLVTCLGTMTVCVTCIGSMTSSTSSLDCSPAGRHRVRLSDASPNIHTQALDLSAFHDGPGDPPRLHDCGCDLLRLLNRAGDLPRHHDGRRRLPRHSATLRFWVIHSQLSGIRWPKASDDAVRHCEDGKIDILNKTDQLLGDGWRRVLAPGPQGSRRPCCRVAAVPRRGGRSWRP